jgi:hypothetical protein
MSPTTKQRQRLRQLVDYLGEGRVHRYFQQQFSRGTWDDISRRQAQKVISGLSPFLPTRPVTGVGPWTLSRDYWDDS